MEEESIAIEPIFLSPKGLLWGELFCILQNSNTITNAWCSGCLETNPRQACIWDCCKRAFCSDCIGKFFWRFGIEYKCFWCCDNGFLVAPNFAKPGSLGMQKSTCPFFRSSPPKFLRLTRLCLVSAPHFLLLAAYRSEKVLTQQAGSILKE